MSDSTGVPSRSSIPGRVAASLVAAAVLAGCASQRLSDADRYALYAQHAGAEVDHFRYLGRINGWTPLGDSALAVWTRPGEAWLLDLSGPCQDLDYTPAIGLTSTMSRVSARFDRVLVRSRSSIDIPCHIRQIRPLDVAAIREAQRRNPEDAPSMDAPSDQRPDSGT